MTSAITFSIRGPSSIGFSLGSAPALGFGVTGLAAVYQALPAYEGPMEITPTQQAQVLDTDRRSVYGSITINPIPSNYGLITYNGSKITVS